MKNRLIAAAGAAAFTAVGFAASMVAAPAEAQQAQKAPVILILDREMVITQSKAGKTIPAQAEKIKADVQKELLAEGEKLKKDVESYQKNASLMSQEVRTKTEQDLSARQQYVLPQQAQIMEQAFGMAVQNAQAKILTESRPFLSEIVEKRGATVLLDRASVLYAAPETDITAEVIAALDKKMSTVAVEKVSLAEITKKLKEAQVAQGQQQAAPKKK